MPSHGRVMTARIRVRGWLRLRSPLHVGGADHDPNTPISVALDGLGRPYVPGTSLAGPLRAWTARDSDPADLWGYVEQGGQDGTASRVVVRDALVATSTRLAPDGTPADCLPVQLVDTRTGVGIDRVTGAAAAGILYERAVLPAGCYLRLELDVESTTQRLAADRQQVAALLDALAHGRVPLGAAKTRGLGQVVLCDADLDIAEERLDSLAGLLAAVRGQAPRRDRAQLHPGPWPTPTQLTAVVQWTPAAPVMVRAPMDGTAVQALPMVEPAGPDQVRLILPGSALKGALRSHAERIERTATRRDVDLPAGTVAEQAAAFRQQLLQLPVAGALFGTAPPSPDRQTPADPGGAGALTVYDCPSTTTIPRSLWERLYTDTTPGAGDGSRLPDDLRDALARFGLERADHVAIDRWTGGAAPGRLFSVLEPAGVTWEPIRLTVDLDRLDRHGAVPADTALALLLLLLRDVQAGKVPLGHATGRGLGDITVTTITLTAPDWPEPATLDTALGSPPAARITAQWCAYLDGSVAP